MKPSHLIFVCMNQRDESDPKGSCHAKFAPLVLQKFRAELDKHGLTHARLVPSGCLGPCSEGVCVTVQPQNVWYGKVRAVDVIEIVEKHIKDGQTVTRLELPDELLD